MTRIAANAVSPAPRIPEPRRPGGVGSAEPTGASPGSPAVSSFALMRHVQHLDRRLAEALRPLALPVLRILLGLLFVWFGALKLVGASPVEGLVSGTLPWVDRDLVIPALGAVEVVLGLGLLTGVLLRLVLPVLAAHLTGTFLTFVMLPAVMFREHNPLLLTADGEFVTKNLVLISATVVLIAHVDGAQRFGARRR